MPTEGLRPAAFIDRDGVINADLGHVGHIKDFRLLGPAVPGLKLLARCGYALIVVTNQAGIAKGKYTEEDYQAVTAHMRALLEQQQVQLEAVYFCPHHPEATVSRYRGECDCRKPAPGMLLRAAQDLGLDLSRSVMVGDKLSDVEAGRAAQVHRTVLVESGHALPADTRPFADHRCKDLYEAASWICKQSVQQQDMVTT